MKNQLVTLVLSEVPKAVRGKVFKSETQKSSPHYFPSSVPHLVTVGEEKKKIGGSEVTFSILGYIPYILVIQASIELKNIFDREQTSDWETKLYEESYRIVKKWGGSEDMSEMYSIFEISGYVGDPEQFLVHASTIASLLKSETINLDPKEVEYTLSAQIKYAKHDLSIIDWDGAFLFDVEGDFGLAVELLMLANLQLLRHRILDKRLDNQLANIQDIMKKLGEKKWFSSTKAVSDAAKDILDRRLTWISAFESLERDIKLIGEWYSARFYDLASRKLKISEWRRDVKEKLDSLEDIYSSLVENFSVSTKDRAEWVELIAWFVLQIGWFVLIVLEFLYFTK